MKKIAVLLLAVVMMLALAACGSNNEPAENNNAGVSQSSTENIQPEGDAVPPAGTETETGQPAGTPETASASEPGDVTEGSRILVAYFSATNNTEDIAQKLAEGLGADLYEIVPEQPYTEEDLNYNDRSTRATAEQNDPDARPAISGSVENMDGYDMVLIGYPNWWASIPMPVASFLEEYDLAGKTIVPFCSHGGGRFGQSLTAIAKLAPESTLGEGLSVHYSGGSTLSQDVAGWLEANRLPAGK